MGGLNTIIPKANRARKDLDTLMDFCSDRNQPGLVRVEKVVKYIVFICIPGQKASVI